MSEMNRRGFLLTAAATAAVVSLPVLQAGADESAPRSPGTKPSGSSIDVGLLSSYNKDAVTSTWAPKGKGAFFVIREGDRLYAASSICTHKGCVMTSTPTDIYCKCHKSHFSFQGTVTDGPAKRSLPRYAISVADGHVRVDPSASFSETQWEDASSFISIKSA